MYNSLAFGVFWYIVRPLLQLLLEYFPYFQKDSPPATHFPPGPPSSSALESHSSTMDLPFLDISYKRDHTVCDPLWLTAFFTHMFSGFFLCCSICQYSVFLLLNNIVEYGIWYILFILSSVDGLALVCKPVTVKGGGSAMIGYNSPGPSWYQFLQLKVPTRTKHKERDVVDAGGRPPSDQCRVTQSFFFLPSAFRLSYFPPPQSLFYLFFYIGGSMVCDIKTVVRQKEGQQQSESY